MKTRINVGGDKRQLVIEMAGEITADTAFPKFFRENDNQKLAIQIKGIEYINSGGVRAWISWTTAMRQAFSGSEMSFELMPAIMVKQAAQIRGFLPADSKVKSFVVTYYCETCNATTDVIFEKGVSLDVSQSQDVLIKKISSTTCGACGAIAEIDAIPQDYMCLLD